MTTPEDRYKFLVDYTSSKVVEMLVNEHELTLQDALLSWHNSETFEKLVDKSTAMYIESPMYVYNILKEEFKRGTIRGLTE